MQKKVTMTKEMITHYAHASSDFSPLHFDENVAKVAGFPSSIAHGMLSMGMLQYFIEPYYENGAFVQSFTVRFLKPVFAGETITLDAQLLCVKESQCHFDVDVENEQGEAVISGQLIIKAGEAHC